MSMIGMTVLLAGCGGDQVTPQPPFDETVRNFVSATYAHGVPYDEARALGAPAEPILLKLLDEPTMAPNRSNIVVTLCMLGSDQATNRVIALIESGSGPLPPDELTLRLDAMMALGYAAHVATTQTALAYLLSGVSHDWTSRIAWRLTSAVDPSPRLRSSAIAGLGLSAKPEALKALQDLQAKGSGGGRGGGTPTSEQALIAEAIKANQFIATNGMSRYYETFLRR